MRLSELIPILQVAIGPVILISGVGMLLLSMTNRYGRVIDRSRSLAETLRRSPSALDDTYRAQLRILVRRASLVRLAILLATLSILLSALMIMALFLGVMLNFEIARAVAILFSSSMGLLVGALVTFLADINLSMAALKLELASHGLKA